ncbi:hypothetical protein SAMN05443248_3818 [Bradyrhizobium erythrophlei]|uniref:Uncharacterized protein n=1 Tax=Bradyrhizobium erythrophlei TaxID=1437360 RepID=A0A1M5QIP4_9BRAD|nr:hypothetical protein SAMN05443248_3818 [Bradyrhizobium erythrophlei]
MSRAAVRWRRGCVCRARRCQTPAIGSAHPRRLRHPGKPRKQIVSTMLARDHVVAAQGESPARSFRATMVLFCSKAIRERLRSSTWVMGAPPSVFAQRQRCQTFAAVPIASGPGTDIRRGRAYPESGLRLRRGCRSARADRLTVTCRKPARFARPVLPRACPSRRRRCRPPGVRCLSGSRPSRSHSPRRSLRPAACEGGRLGAWSR